MQRFTPGDRVYVRQSFGTAIERPWPLAIVAASGSLGLYDYVLLMADGRTVYTHDWCLAPVDFVITEDVELTDLYLVGVS